MTINPSSHRMSHRTDTQHTLRESVTLPVLHKASPAPLHWSPFQRKSRQRAIAITKCAASNVGYPFNILGWSKRISQLGYSFSLLRPSLKLTCTTNKSYEFSNQNSTQGESSLRSYHACKMQAPLYKDKGGFYSPHRLPAFSKAFCGPFSPFPEWEKNSAWYLNAAAAHAAL